MDDLAVELGGLAPKVDSTAARALFNRRRQRRRRRTAALRVTIVAVVMAGIAATGIVFAREEAKPLRVTSELVVPEPLVHIAVGEVRVVARGANLDYQWQLNAQRRPNELCVAIQRTETRDDDSGALGALVDPNGMYGGPNFCGELTPTPPVITGAYGFEPFLGGQPGPTPPGETRRHYTYGLTGSDTRLIIGTVNGRTVSQTRPQPVEGLNVQPWIIPVPLGTHYNEVDYVALDGTGKRLGLLTSDSPKPTPPTASNRPSTPSPCPEAQHPWQLGPATDPESGDGLPPTGSATIALAERVLRAKGSALLDQYRGLSASIRVEPGRAWRRRNGSIEIVDEPIATIVLLLPSEDRCPLMPTFVEGVPLTFEVGRN